MSWMFDWYRRLSGYETGGLRGQRRLDLRHVLSADLLLRRVLVLQRLVDLSLSRDRAVACRVRCVLLVEQVLAHLALEQDDHQQLQRVLPVAALDENRQVLQQRTRMVRVDPVEADIVLVPDRLAGANVSQVGDQTRSDECLCCSRFSRFADERLWSASRSWSDAVRWMPGRFGWLCSRRRLGDVGG